jgi:hypothetical protein
MALTAQHSQAWKLILEKRTALATPIYEEALGNSNYQGEVKAHKTVNIVLPGTSTTSAYTGADISFNTPESTSDTLTCDQMRYYADQVRHDVQQGSIYDILADYAQSAAQQLALDVDAYVATLHSSITTNTYGSSASPIVVGLDQVGGEILPSRVLARMARKITASNGDVSDLRVVVPDWFADALLMETSAKLTNRGDVTSEYGVLTGKMPILAGGFKGIYVSTEVPNTADDLWKVMAGSPKSSITIARAISEATTGEREGNFASFIKGLLVFGAKVPKQDNMALATLRPGTDGNGNSLLI